MDPITQKYYDKICKNTSESFLAAFNKEWNLFLQNFNLIYASSEQLQIGNRLRPIMTCWGFMHCHNVTEEIDFHYIAKIAVSLEAIHKASVIIDDVIDGDTKRRGVDCIHVHYSEYEAIFFSVCMISLAINNLNLCLHNSLESKVAMTATSMLCNTIFEMCKGALLEITSTESDRLNMERIQQIIDLETVTLLKNSLLIGYIASGNTNKEMEKMLESIGLRCGYIFQVMNDLEPFCNIDYIEKHKGNLNTDYFKSRKNIVIPYLESVIKYDETKWLKKALTTPGMFMDIKGLFEKYNMKQTILNDVFQKKDSIHQDIKLLKAFSDNNEWIACFSNFVDYLIEYCLSILNGIPQKWE